MIAEIISVVIVMLVVLKFFAVPQSRRVLAEAKHRGGGIAGVVLMCGAFGGMAVMPFIREHHLIDMLAYAIAVLAVIGAALVVWAGRRSGRTDL